VPVPGVSARARDKDECRAIDGHAWYDVAATRNSSRPGTAYTLGGDAPARALT
jgi:hypothetical protein